MGPLFLKSLSLQRGAASGGFFSPKMGHLFLKSLSLQRGTASGGFFSQNGFFFP